MTPEDEKYMQRAIELASLGMGHVSPNPMVGCVIADKNRIIGEGWHRAFGGPHAEVNAIESVKNKDLLPGAHVYVNLEPCAHHGKTPPCAEMLVRYGVERVFIANIDPNPLVGGKGIEIMKKSGIDVRVDLLKDDGFQINKRFFTFIEKRRPYVILKWAQTADGLIARSNFDSKWISNEWSRTLVHKWRAEEDAILVGKNTALYDDPQLGVRDWTGNDPLRIVIDSNLELPGHLKLFDQSVPTLCYNFRISKREGNLEYVLLDRQQPVEYLLTDLYEREVQSLIVEGGAATIDSFLKSGFWDEARIFTSAGVFGNGIAAPRIRDGQLSDTMRIAGDSLSVFIKA